MPELLDGIKLLEQECARLTEITDMYDRLNQLLTARNKALTQALEPFVSFVNQLPPQDPRSIANRFFCHGLKQHIHFSHLYNAKKLLEGS